MRWSRREFTRAGALGAVGGLVARSPVEAEDALPDSQRAPVDAEPRRGRRSSCAPGRSRRSSSRARAWPASRRSIRSSTPSSRSRRTSALAAARAAEEEIGRGSWKGPLHGIPIALKDLVDTRGVRTTAGSNVYKDRVPTEDAEIVRRLEGGGRGAARQAEPARVRVRRQHGRERLRPRAQPVVARALGGRLVGGLGRCRRRRPVLRRHRLRHGGLDPPARRVLRHRRPQADVRPREHARRHPARRVARPRRADDPARARRRPDAAAARRLRRGR